MAVNEVIYKGLTVKRKIVTVNVSSMISIGPFVRRGSGTSGSNTRILSVQPHVPDATWIAIADIFPSDQSSFYVYANGEAKLSCEVLYIDL